MKMSNDDVNVQMASKTMFEAGSSSILIQLPKCINVFCSENSLIKDVLSDSGNDEWGLTEGNNLDTDLEDKFKKKIP